MCEGCGETYTPRGNAQRFCSRTCRNRAINAGKRLADKACEMCGVTYHPYYGAQKYCSRRCMGLGGRSYAVCENCGEMFRMRKRARYCSFACKGQGMRVPLGTKRTDAFGYVLVRVPEDTPGLEFDRAWMREHRYVMQQYIGRPLDADETVHHINGDKQDNRIENLQLRTGRHGKGAAFECCDCGSRNIRAVEI